jgi:hypothetical protein
MSHYLPEKRCKIDCMHYLLSLNMLCVANYLCISDYMSFLNIFVLSFIPQFLDFCKKIALFYLLQFA